MTFIDEPRLFQTPEARTAFQEGLKATFREFLNKKFHGELRTKHERLLSGYTKIGNERPVNRDSAIVTFEAATLFLEGKSSIALLRDSTLTLLDHTSDWTLVRVKDQEGNEKRETPYYFPLSDFDNVNHPTDSDGFIMHEQTPQLPDLEFMQNRDVLLDMLRSKAPSVSNLLSFHGFSDQARLIENRLEEIRRGYVKNWIDGLKGRFTEFTIEQGKLVKPSDLKGKLFFSVVFNGPVLISASLKRVLDPVVWVGTGELKSNKVQEVSFSKDDYTDPESVDRTMNGFLVDRADFKVLKAELERILEISSNIKGRLKPEFNRELRTILSAVIGDVLSIAPYVVQQS